MPSIACQNPSLTFMALTARACDYAVKELKKEIFRLKVRMRKLKMGMVGGGKNAFIGAIHRIAANIDGLMNCTVVLWFRIRNIKRIRKSISS
jgi:hypothetical protein